MWALGVGIFLTTTACGYSLAGRGSYLPTYIRAVAVPPITNRTALPRVELIVTERVRSEFIGRGRFTLVQDPAAADAVLNAEIVAFDLQPVGLNNQQLASRYLISIVIRASFTDVRTKEVLWSNDALTFREEYDLPAGPTGATVADLQGSAQDRIATDVARSLVTAVVEAF